MNQEDVHTDQVLGPWLSDEKKRTRTYNEAAGR